MHARRPFVQALEARDPSAIFFVERFQSVYRVEADARSQALTASQRLELRRERGVPIALRPGCPWAAEQRIGGSGANGPM